MRRNYCSLAWSAYFSPFDSSRLSHVSWKDVWWACVGVSRPVGHHELQIATWFCCLIDTRVFSLSFPLAFSIQPTDLTRLRHGTESESGVKLDQNDALPPSCCGTRHLLTTTISICSMSLPSMNASKLLEKKSLLPLRQFHSSDNTIRFRNVSKIACDTFDVVRSDAIMREQYRIARYEGTNIVESTSIVALPIVTYSEGNVMLTFVAESVLAGLHVLASHQRTVCSGRNALD